MNHIHVFTSADKGYWFKTISEIRLIYHFSKKPLDISLDFSENIKKNEITPSHLVSYACLIQELKNHGHNVYQLYKNEEIANYIYNDLGFKYYFSLKENHVKSSQNNVLNLWRIVPNEVESYARDTTDYFKLKFFKGKDTTQILYTLLESYYNVLDHADAGNNAFSLVQYLEDQRKIYVAISDFGIGIKSSVQTVVPSITTDLDALKKASELNFTVKSKSHNGGKGISNILDMSTRANILSGEAMLYKFNDVIKYYELDFSYSGTLIYCTIDVNSMPDDEVLTQFEIG